MGNFKFIHPTIEGLSTVQGANTSDNGGDFNIPFTKVQYPGICLFGDDAGLGMTSVDYNSQTKERIIRRDGSAYSCIKYIQNDGFVNPNASETVPSLSSSPFIDTLCRASGAPFRILRVLDSQRFVILDVYSNWSNSDCYFTKSSLYPNKKVVAAHDQSFVVYGIGGILFPPIFNGVNYTIEIGDGVSPLDIIGCDTEVNFYTQK